MTIGKIEAKDEAVALEFRDDRIWLTLRDSRIVSMPISRRGWGAASGRHTSSVSR